MGSIVSFVYPKQPGCFHCPNMSHNMSETKMYYGTMSWWIVYPTFVSKSEGQWYGWWTKSTEPVGTLVNIADFWECLFLNQLMLKFLFLTEIYIFQNVYKSIIFIKTVVTSSAGGDLLELPRVQYFGTEAIFNSWTDFPTHPKNDQSSTRRCRKRVTAITAMTQRINYIHVYI